MKKVLVLMILVLSLAACRNRGVTIIDRSELPSDIYSAAPPTPTLGIERTFSLFFVREANIEPTQRTTREAGSVRTTMKMLLEGPNPEEQALGLSTSIPRGVELLSVRESAGVASIDLTSEFESEAEEKVQLLRVAQVVFSVTAIKGIERVMFLIDGEQSSVLIDDGTVVSRPVGRSDYSSLVAR